MVCKKISNQLFCDFFSHKFSVQYSWCCFIFFLIPNLTLLHLLYLLLPRLHLHRRLYKYQAHGYAFSSVEELLNSLGGSGFINMTRRPLSDSLLELGVSQRFIEEVIVPIIRVNYGQNISIPAFIGQRVEKYCWSWFLWENVVSGSVMF